ncbi:MAG: hypothetical protein HZB16_18995 [Armatimonadetes bacterium]|nr:hypothetical protein [Armatimonadota bacterium]
MRASLLGGLLCLLLTPSAWAADPLVSSVNVVGLLRVPAAAIAKNLPLAKGDPALKRNIDGAREWLESLGLFLSVATKQTNRGNQVDVTYTVVENPPVGAVLISPVPGISSAGIRNELDTKPKDILSRVRVASDSLKIAALYRKIGLVVEVETVFDPAPTQTTTPVNTTFKVTQLLVGRVVCEPLNYVKAEVVQPLIKLAAGEPLRLERLAEQQRALADFPLFVGVGEPSFRRDKALPAAQVELTFPVQEAEQPLVVEQTLPMLDMERLRRWVRFAAVDINVALNDMEFVRSPEEAKALYDRAETAARALDDGDAAWQAAYWARHCAALLPADAPVKTLERAGERLDALCAAGGTARDHLRLGQVYMLIGRRVDAANQFVQALDRKPEGLDLAETYAELAAALASLLSSGEQQVAELCKTHIKAGADALSKLPTDTSPEVVTEVAQFYFVGLSLARLHMDLKAPMRLDSPLAGWLFRAAHTLGEKQPASDAADSPEVREQRRLGHHLGKLLTSVVFVARSMGPEVIGLDGMNSLPDILDAARDAFLSPGHAQSTDPTIPFFLSLNNVLVGNLLVARDEALSGLARYPSNERLVDIYLLCCLENVYSGLTQEQALKALDNALSTLGPDVEAGRLNGPGHALLVTKLQMALYQTLNAADAPARAKALAATVQAAQLTIQRAPDWASGYWFAGMAALKGAEPGTAVAPYRRVVALQPANGEARYALALALIASGARDEGLKMMDALRTKPAPDAQKSVGPPAPTPAKP